MITVDYRRLAREAEEKLKNSDSPKTEAFELVRYVFGVDRSAVLLKSTGEADEDRLRLFGELVGKRASGYPLQYIIGEWDFCSRTFAVREGVLIPRCESEQLVIFANEYLKKRVNDGEEPVVFDLCAGSGCIGLSVAADNPKCRVYLFDVSGKAIECQSENKLRLHADNAVILNYDIKRGFDGGILPPPDVVLSNPPYISDAEMEHLQKEVTFEPDIALRAGRDGLDFYPVIAQRWLPYIKKDGCFALECGENQSETIIELICKEKINTKPLSRRDIFGVTRYVCGVVN